MPTLVADATVSPAEEVPDERELVQVAAELARSGNMTAVGCSSTGNQGRLWSEFERIVGARLEDGQ